VRLLGLEHLVVHDGRTEGKRYINEEMTYVELFGFGKELVHALDDDTNNIYDCEVEVFGWYPKSVGQVLLHISILYIINL
jgi:hypothetical protein